jgi:hypothetical protein
MYTINRLAILLAVFWLSVPGAYAVPPTVYVVDSVATLRTGNFSAYPNLRLSGWRTAGDGGEGNLIAIPSDTSSSDNSCTIYVDVVGTRFYRLENNARKEINFYQCGAYGDGTASHAVDTTNAISNAIAAATTIGAPNGGVYARVVCPAGVFLINGITISAGQRIELVGQHTAGVSGCQIKSSSTSVDLITVNADTFRMEDVWLFGGNATGSGNCLVLGSSSQTTNDTIIGHSWISNCSNAGIKIINAQGIWLDHTTIEIAYTYGILANVAGSSGLAQNVTINGSTFYGNTTAISIAGTSSTDSSNASNWNIVGGSEFNNNASASTCTINIQQANSVNITGNRFDVSRNHDICGSSVGNLTVSSNSWSKGGGAAVNCSGCSSVVASNNNGGQMWLGYAVGFQNSAIFVLSNNSSGNIVMGNSFSCAIPHAMFGLYTDSTSTNTGVGPNLFSCQTTNAYDVLGSKAWNY